MRRIIKKALLWNRKVNRAGVYLGNYWHFNVPTLSLMKLPQPNLVIIGAMKSGTTSLYRYVSRHPQIFMSSIKEPGYFLKPSDRRFRPQYDSPNNIRFNLSDEELLFRMLNGYTGQPIFGEASTHYTKDPEHGMEVPRRCKELSPSIKFIYIMRNPFDRMVSQYLHCIRAGYTNDDFNRVIREDDLYVSFSLYGMQIRKYLDQFSLDRFLFLSLEDLEYSPHETMRTVWQFIGVEHHEEPKYQIHHASNNFGLFSSEQLLFTCDNYDHIYPLFQEDLAELRETTGFANESWDLSADRWTSR